MKVKLRSVLYRESVLMDQKNNTFFFTVFLLALCIPATSAWAVEDLTSDSPGSLSQNTPVTVSYNITFPSSSDLTFPAGSDLVMTTDLVESRWTYTLILDGVENQRNPENGQTLELSGFELSYPSSVDESIRVTLEGNAPSSSDFFLVKIQEIDTHGRLIDPVYYLRANGGIRANRDLPASISPGSQFTVHINPTTNLSSDPGWKISETVPFGFSFVRTTAFYEIQTGPNSYLFIQNSSTPFSYVVTAPHTEGPFTFSGSYTDGNKITGVVSGDTIADVGTSYQNYINATTGKIEQVDAQKAIRDNIEGRLSNQGAGSVLENYFLGK